MSELKSGIHTTEFWVTLITSVALLVKLFMPDIEPSEELITQIAALFPPVIYIISRTIVKSKG